MSSRVPCLGTLSLNPWDLLPFSQNRREGRLSAAPHPGR